LKTELEQKELIDAAAMIIGKDRAEVLLNKILHEQRFELEKNFLSRLVRAPHELDVCPKCGRAKLSCGCYPI